MWARLPPPAAKSAPSRPGPIELEFEATSPSVFMPGAERAVELGLDLAVLHARFDDQVAVEEIGDRAGDLDALDLAIDVGWRQRALLDRALVLGAQLVGHAGGELGQRHVADDLVAGLERQPADGVAHVAVDAVDADLLQRARLAREALRQLLHRLLGEEEAHAGLALGRGGDVEEGVALELDRVLRAAAPRP